MFAIVRLGNQQFKVKAGDFIRVPFQNQSPKDSMEIPVVAFGSETEFIFDRSQLKNSKVKAVVIRQSLARKVLVFKKKRRKGYRRTRGHRQKFTELKILELCSPKGEVSEVESKKKVVAQTKASEAKNPVSKVESKKKAIAPTKASEVKNPVSKVKSEKKTSVQAKAPAKKKNAAPTKAKKASHKKVKKQADRVVKKSEKTGWSRKRNN